MGLTNNPDLTTLPGSVFAGYGLDRALHPVTNLQHLEKIAEVMVERQREAESCQYQLFVVMLGRAGRWYSQLVVLDQPTPGSTPAHELAVEAQRRLEYFRVELERDDKVARIARQILAAERPEGTGSPGHSDHAGASRVDEISPDQ